MTMAHWPGALQETWPPRSTPLAPALIPTNALLQDNYERATAESLPSLPDEVAGFAFYSAITTLFVVVGCQDHGQRLILSS